MSKPLENFTVKELLEIARQKNLKGYSKLRKVELISLINSEMGIPKVIPKVIPDAIPDGIVSKNLENFTVKELLDIARLKNLSGYSKMRKAELISLINSSTGYHNVIPKIILQNKDDKCINKICVPSKICNPDSGICVNKTGNIGKKLVNFLLNEKINKPDWTIYSIDGCNSCKKAVKLLDSVGLKYTQIKVRDEDKKDFFKEKASLTGGYKYFPVIFNMDVFIGGYTELEKIITKPLSSGSSSFHMLKPPIVEKTNFEGSSWDDLVSMIYLLHRHPKDCVAIPKDLLTGSGKITQKGFKVKNFNDTSLSWTVDKNMFYIPVGLWDSIKDCLKRKPRFIVMPLGINGINSWGKRASHANFLIYNTGTKVLERFEPHGKPMANFLNIPDFEKKLADLFNNNVHKDMIREVYDPLSFCPAVNVQKIQVNELDKKIGEIGGFCVAWSAWYADIRMSNPKKSRSEVVSIGIEKLKKNNYSFTQFIRSYSSFLTKVGEQLKNSNNPAAVFAAYVRKSS
jgi:glutaredoxin